MKRVFHPVGGVTIGYMDKPTVLRLVKEGKMASVAIQRSGNVEIVGFIWLGDIEHPVTEASMPLGSIEQQLRDAGRSK